LSYCQVVQHLDISKCCGLPVVVGCLIFLKLANINIIDANINIETDTDANANNVNIVVVANFKPLRTKKC